MKRRQLLRWLLVAALLAIPLAFLISRLEWRDVSYRTGWGAEARSNPLHAALLLLRRLDIPARVSSSADSLAELPTDQTLVLSGTAYFARPEARDALLAWIRRGGHLVLAIEARDHQAELLRALGIEIVGSLGAPLPDFLEMPAMEARSLEIEGHRMKISGLGAPAFELQERAGAEVLWEARRESPLRKEDETRLLAEDLSPSQRRAMADALSRIAPAIYARIALGKGFVTVGSFAPFRNASLRHHDHAAAFVRLVTLPDGARPVLMLAAPAYPQLPAWLWAHAPGAILAALLLLAALLWHVMPRFGPLLAEPPPARPGLGEHLAASARFLLDQQALDALLTPLREDVLRLLATTLHHYPDMPDTLALARMLSGLPAVEIERALSEHPAGRHDFLARARCLARLRDACQRLPAATSAGVRP